MLRQGTIVDATIIAAPGSTKSKEGKRDPGMRQTKKGSEWFFGMKAHIGVDAQSGLVHSMTCAAANEHDLSQAESLLHGDEAYVFADAGYVGIDDYASALAQQGLIRSFSSEMRTNGATAENMTNATIFF